MFLWGMLGFTAASAVCGAAPDAIALIASRVVQGACSGLMFPQLTLAAGSALIAVPARHAASHRTEATAQ